MINEKTFTVYVGQEIRGEFPVVVITSGKGGDTGYILFSEYFICIYSKDDNKYYKSRFNHRGSEPACKLFGIDEQYMAQQAFEQAKFKLRRYLDDKYPTDNNLPCNKRDFNLQESNEAVLVGLYLRDYFDKELTSIGQQTLSEDLKHFISEVLNLTKIVTNENI